MLTLEWIVFFYFFLLSWRLTINDETVFGDTASPHLTLIWELIFIYCGLFFLILVVFVLFLLSLRFSQISPLAFFRWYTATSDRNADLVTVSPVITAFHSCCLSHHVFWPSKPLADMVRIWNRYLLTMPSWNLRDSTSLSAAPRAPKGIFHYVSAKFHLWPSSGDLPRPRIILRLRSLVSKWFQLMTWLWVDIIFPQNCNPLEI